MKDNDEQIIEVLKLWMGIVFVIGGAAGLGVVYSIIRALGVFIFGIDIGGK